MNTVKKAMHDYKAMFSEKNAGGEDILAAIMLIGTILALGVVAIQPSFLTAIAAAVWLLWCWITIPEAENTQK